MYVKEGVPTRSLTTCLFRLLHMRARTCVPLQRSAPLQRTSLLPDCRIGRDDVGVRQLIKVPHPALLGPQLLRRSHAHSLARSQQTGFL